MSESRRPIGQAEFNKAKIELMDELGMMLGMTLPIIFQNPPSSPEATKETLKALEPLLEEVQIGVMEMRVPATVQAFFESLILGLVRYRDGKGMPSGD